MGPGMLPVHGPPPRRLGLIDPGGAHVDVDGEVSRTPRAGDRDE